MRCQQLSQSFRRTLLIFHAGGAMMQIAVKMWLRETNRLHFYAFWQSEEMGVGSGSSIDQVPSPLTLININNGSFRLETQTQLHPKDFRLWHFPLWFSITEFKRLKTFGFKVNCPLNAEGRCGGFYYTNNISLGYRDGVLLEVYIVAGCLFKVSHLQLVSLHKYYNKLI